MNSMGKNVIKKIKGMGVVILLSTLLGACWQAQAQTVVDGDFTVSLTVKCDTLLDNMHMLDRDKHELVPPDGIIFPTTIVAVYEGDTVFDLLQREMRNAGIHMSSRFTPAFNSAYVEAINNLYEFDGGPLSGWMYKVNDWFPNFGSCQYILQPDDVIVWVYTLDLGRDVGENWMHGDWLNND